ncbi:MAG: CGNR zinc finger domain-containing protein [Hyphomicrobiales bacterium]
MCFVDTLGARGGRPREHLRTTGDLETWLVQSGLSGAAPSGLADTDLADARRLREAVHRAAAAVAGGAAPRLADIAEINAAARKLPLRPQIAGAGGRELVAGDIVPAALSTIAEDAVDMLTGTRRGRIRVCPGCAMLFEDTSRPGRRRWCSSASGCGNKAKTRAYRLRGKGQSPSGAALGGNDG